MTQSRRAHWNQRYASRKFVWSKPLNQMLVNALEPLALPPGHVLDLACGEGHNAIWLAEQGWQVTAVDFSIVGVETGKRIANRRSVRVDWIVDNATTWQAPAGTMDLAIVLYLHTDAVDRAAWMAHTLDALKSGGALVYIAHDLTNLVHGQLGPQTPDVLATPEDIVALLPGCHIDRAEVLERQVDDEPEHGGAKLGTAFDVLVVAFKGRQGSATEATINPYDRYRPAGSRCISVKTSPVKLRSINHYGHPLIPMG